MSVESAADRLAFFDTDEHGTAATYTSVGGGAVPVAGIFENEYVTVFDGDSTSVESAGPIFTCRTADIPGATHGATLKIGSTVYTVRGVQPDGTGMTVLRLESPS